MDHSISSRSLSCSPSASPFNSKRTILNPLFHKFNFDSRNFKIKPLISRQNRQVAVTVRASSKKVNNDGFVLEDVIKKSMIKRMPGHICGCSSKVDALSLGQTFVSSEDAVAQKIVTKKDSPRGVHFRRAGPRVKVMPLEPPK